MKVVKPVKAATPKKKQSKPREKMKNKDKPYVRG